MNKVILIVDDDSTAQFIYEKGLAGMPVSIITAYTLEEAAEKFAATPAIDLIVMDGCVDSGNTLNTLPLIEKIRETYEGPMIAASSLDTYRYRMMKSGCSHEAAKPEVAALIKKILTFSS